MRRAKDGQGANQRMSHVVTSLAASRLDREEVGAGNPLHEEYFKLSVIANQNGERWPHLQIQHLLPGVVDEVAGESSRGRAVREDDGVFGVLAPLDEEFSGKAWLEVGLAAQHHLGAGHPGQIC